MNPATPRTSNRYTSTAIGLHWLMAVALVATFALGFYMYDLPFSPNKLRLFSWHKWVGVTIFAVLLFRIVWRLTHRPPGLPERMPLWQKRAAEVTHLALYGLMIAIPLSGWLMSSAKGFQTVWFGVLPIPDLLEKNEDLGDLLQIVHQSLNILLALTVSAHVGAALKHHFINRDDVLRRMLPFSRR